MTGRQRRRQYEWQLLKKLAAERSDISINITRQDAEGIPCAYAIYYNIHSICGINKDGTPVFSDHFCMLIDIPDDYPQVDAPPQFRFVKEMPNASTTKLHDQITYPLPWHPNIRYHGDMAGHVCINALNTFIDIAWGVERVALYLRYELYHALPEPPYPEDLTVAEWVRHTGEPNEYIFFNQ